MNMPHGLSLRLVNEESYLFVLKVKEPILLMHRMTPEVVPQNHVPISTVVLVQKLL